MVPPTLSLAAPTTTSATSTTLTVTASAGSGPGFSGTYTIDVDLNHDGVFDGPGEQGYVTGTLDPHTLSAQAQLFGLVAGTYQIRASALALDGTTIYSGLVTLRVVQPTGGHLPLSFEPNQGQTDAQVQYLARTQNSTAYFVPGQFVVDSTWQATQNNQTVQDEFAQRIQFANANADAQYVAGTPLPGTVNYLIGNDATQWLTNIPTSATLLYQNVWNGIDVQFNGNQGDLRYNFVVAPGADPNQISLAFPDATTLQVDNQGELVMTTPGGQFIQPAPVAYQQEGTGTVAIVSNYVVAGNTVYLNLGNYDYGKQLTIDPTFTAATYLGGSSTDATAENINTGGPNLAVDSLGNVYVAGYSISTNYPTTPGVLQPNRASTHDNAVVSKLNSSETALLWSTYIGGATNTKALGMALDSNFDVYVAGQTTANNYPTTAGVVQTAYLGNNSDGFVSKLNPTGTALVYSTYLGGSNNGPDVVRSIAVNAAGDAFVTGETNSHVFPTTPGVFQPTIAANPSGFLSKFNPTATGFVYSTYVDGGAQAHPREVVLGWCRCHRRGGHHLRKYDPRRDARL